MDVFARLIPYVKPHSRKIVISWLLATLVALLWGANFMAAWPIVKTLFDGKTLQQEVTELIAEAEAEIVNREASIAELDKQIAARRAEVGENVSDGRIMRMTQSRGRQVGKLEESNKSLASYRWVEYRILPWLPETLFPTFLLILGGLFLATVLKCVCLYFQELLVGQIVEETIEGVRKDCLRHALDLDYATTSAEGTAGLMARFTFDAQQVAESLTLLSGRLVREPLKALVCVGVAMYVNWRLTLLSVVVAPILGFVLYRVGKRLKQASTRMMESMTRIYEQLEETLNGLKVVLAFNRQQTHQEQFDREYSQYLNKALKVVRFNSMTRPASEIISTLAVMIAMLPCAYLVLSGETYIWEVKLASKPMDVATVAMMYGALAGLLDPCQKLSKVYARLKRGTAAVDRIFAFLDTPSRTPKPAIAKAMPPVQRTITFRDVSFQYPTPKDTDAINPLILKSLNLTIEAGECVAIVGENGCGKSTLLSLVPRFQEPTSGTVFIDDIPLCDIPPDEVRSAIGLVAQDTLLFSGTILDNIRYGSINDTATVTEQEIHAAAEAASVSQFVANLPNGFETEVGVHGKSLSGGQRQRIALARAMIRDPKLLLLDEATSAIDAQSRQAIHAALKTFVQGRTTLLVTHSVSPTLLEFVTRIVVLNEGVVEADGTHEQLLATSPTYQRLFAAPIKMAA